MLYLFSLFPFCFVSGVYKVDVDAEQQKVTVSGSVEPSALIKKLLRAGKHAELWSQKSNQDPKPQQAHCVKDEKNAKGQKVGLIKGLKAFKNQHNFPSLGLEDEEDCDEDDDDGYDEEEEEELRFISEKAKHLDLLKQANEANAKKAAVAANTKATNGGGNGNAGKKGGGENPNQNVGFKNMNGGSDPKSMSFQTNNKINGNFHLGGVGGIGNPNYGGGQGNRLSEINGMGLGFHDLGASGLAFQGQPNAFQGCGLPTSGSGAFGAGNNLSPMMLNLQGSSSHQQQHHHPSSSLGMDMNMNMNMYNRQSMINDNRFIQPQPQMMFHKSPIVHPFTGYYQYPPLYPTIYPDHTDNATAAAAAQEDFNNQTASSCSIM